MALIDLNIPAGIYRNGTELQSIGRWRDANLVRWHDGVMRPMGGWRHRAVEAGTANAANAKLRGMTSWVDNGGDKWIAAGSYNKLYVWNVGNEIFDITPTGLTAGQEDSGVLRGYGINRFGAYEYGNERPDTSNIQPATSWHLKQWGENLIACNAHDGKIYEWSGVTSSPAAQISNAPIDNKAVVVTEQRFLVALGAGGNPRLVQWSDREDNTSWTPLSTNEAGDLELNTTGEIMAGMNVQSQTLILTSRSAHVMNYVGPPYVYGIERVGTSCGLAAAQAYAVVDAGAFWMGANSFFTYQGGRVQELPSEVSDYVFNDINVDSISHAFAMSNAMFGEIWWFYPSGASTENDRYVVYNYTENTWYIGELVRTAGVDRGSHNNPTMASASDYKLYEHEIGFNYDALTPYAESGPFRLGTGDQVMKVTQMIPDEKTQGDVTATFKTRFYPNEEDRIYGPFPLENPTPVRFTGRQVRLRVEGARLADWRVGMNRIEAVAGGRR